MPKTSVTQVIDYFQHPRLVDWKLCTKEWKKISQESLRVGKIVDQFVQDDICGRRPDIEAHRNDAPTFTALSNWVCFKQNNGALVSKLIQFKDTMQTKLCQGDLVGHPDFLLDDEVIDLKTSKQISTSHWIQTAQYAKMAGGRPKISIVRVDKNATDTFQYVTLEEPFISFWQSKFEARYVAYKEEGEFREMMRKKLEEEKLK